MKPLNIEKIKIEDLESLKRNSKYHSIGRILKIECLKCSNIHYQDIYYHIHGGSCLKCSFNNIVSIIS